MRSIGPATLIRARLSPRHLFLALALVFTVSLVILVFRFNIAEDSLSNTTRMDPNRSGGSIPQAVDDAKSSTKKLEGLPFASSPVRVVEEPVRPAVNVAGANRRVHIFYYPWYGNPATDAGGWNHWNHQILPHWNEVTRKQYIHDVNYVPPDDIGAIYYPKDGPYSSSDPAIVAKHMEELKEYVVVVSWWGASTRANSKDSQGAATDLLMPLLFKGAEKSGAQIAVHLEPYPGRSEVTVREDLEYLIEKYGSSPAFYRDTDSGRPVVYLYDSYLTPPLAWSKILAKDGSSTIRGTEYDAVILGLYVHKDSAMPLVEAHFDGFYTYFAAEGFTYGSSSANWQEMVKFAQMKNLKTSLSVGPGYDDRRIRPWNSENMRDRRDGKYYDEHWQAALDLMPTYISVTSFNEWMEGTQIEPVVPKKIAKTIFDGKSFTYLDYGSLGPNHYLEKTHHWASKFRM